MLRVQRFWRGACCASLLVSCATAPLASPPKDPVATLGDDLIAAGIEAELDKAAISAHRSYLRRDCDAGSSSPAARWSLSCPQAQSVKSGSSH